MVDENSDLVFHALFRKWQPVSYGKSHILLTALTVYASFRAVAETDGAIRRAVATYSPQAICKGFKKLINEAECAQDDFLAITMMTLNDFAAVEGLETRFQDEAMLVALAKRAWIRLKQGTSSQKDELTLSITRTISK